MATFNIRGIEMAGTRKGDGPPLLMLHGAGGPASNLACAERLSTRFDVLAPHHPAFGESAVVDDIDSIDDLAYLYLDLLAALDLRDVTLIGFSMGGWLASEIAVRSTERIQRLMLVDAVGIKMNGREDRTIPDIFALPPDQFADLVFHEPAAYTVDPASLSDEDLILNAKNREAAARYCWLPYMHNPKLMGRLHRIDVPTRVVWGESDRLVPIDYGRAYCDAIPGAEWAVIPKAGHQPQLEQTDAFVEQVFEFTATGTG